MRIMKITAQSLCLLGAMTVLADATPRWEGFALGVQLGNGWTHSEWSYQNSNYFNTAIDMSGNPYGLGNNFTNNSDGFLGGGFAGYNFRVSGYIVGLEATIWGTDMKNIFESPFYSTDQYSSRIHTVAMARGRVGYPIDRWLLSFTGGWAGEDTELTLKDPIFNVKASQDIWANGWTVGGSVDYKLWLHMTAGLAYDYIYVTYDNKTIDCPSCPGGAGGGTPDVSATLKTQTVTARISYLF